MRSIGSTSWTKKFLTGWKHKKGGSVKAFAVVDNDCKDTEIILIQDDMSSNNAYGIYEDEGTAKGEFYKPRK